MAVRIPSKPRRSRRATQVRKPGGSVSGRVQKVGPERFGFVCVDPHKGSSKWMMTDFYGRTLAPPAELEHRGPQLRAAVEQVRQICREQDIADCLVVIERTGRYQLPVQRAFADAGFETRIIHPFATKQFRQAEVRYQGRSLEKILAWARTAAPADPDPELPRQIRTALDDDRIQKRLQIKGLEGEIAAGLLQTP